MPKVEIHVHLEGAVDPETSYEMAVKNKVDLPVKSLDEWKEFYEFRDFNHFIEVYILAAKSMQTPEDYVTITEHFLKKQSEQHIRYSEAYFSPTLHRDKKISNNEILNALAEGARLGEQKYKSSVKFIADISRESSEDQFNVLDFAIRGMEKGIFIGFGVGGPEQNNPPEKYIESFSKARDAGLHVVAHAGEGEGPQSIRGAIKHLKAERIGHGTRMFEDETLIPYLRELQIPIEVSPNSNYCLKIIKTDEPHPVRRMVDEGLFVTLNSDDPPMFSTSLNNEYLTLACQGFTWDELWKLNLKTLDASFLPDKDKSNFKNEWNLFQV
jgi:adenosine deaminase